MDKANRLVSQQHPGFAGPSPPLSLELPANANASALQVGSAVPSNITTAIPSTVPGVAAAPDQLQMLKMLAQQVSTAPPGPDVAMPGAPRIITTQQRLEVPTLMQATPDIEVVQAPGVVAALSMLPSPLPLDLSGTGMQSHLAAHPGLAHQHQQQVLQYGMHQPHMQLRYPVQQQQLQYSGHLQPLQYQGMTQQQLHYAAPHQQQQHMHLQYALNEQQQQQQRQQMLQLMLQQQQRNQQLAQHAALRQAEAAAAATQGTASGSLMMLLTEQQDQQQQQQQGQMQQVSQQMIMEHHASMTAAPAPTSLLQLLTENQEAQPLQQQQHQQSVDQSTGAAAATSAALPEQQLLQQDPVDVPQHTPANPQPEPQAHTQQLEQQHNPATAAAASAAEPLVQPGDVKEAQPAMTADPAAAAAAAVTADVAAQPEAADVAKDVPDTANADPGSSAAAAAPVSDQPLEPGADSMDLDNSADGANPTSSAGGSTGAAAAAAAGSVKGSKYGAKRAAALKRQGYTNSVPGPTGNGKSNFRGVFWDRKNSRWRAQVGFNNRKIFMGYFGEPAEAARAYDKKVVQLHGALAKTNFPLEDYAEDLKAFNQQQQQEQQMMSQQQIVARPRRVRHRSKYGSESDSDGGDSAAERDYMDTDTAAGGMAGFNAQQGMQGISMPGHMAAAAGGGVGAPPGFYGPGHMGNGSHMLMGGYSAPVSHGMAVEPAAAAAAADGAAGQAGGALHRMLSGSTAADPAGELPADVAAAVAAAAALVGVAAGEQPDPAAAAAGVESTVGMKRKRSTGDVADALVLAAQAAQAVNAATATAAGVADAANPAPPAGARDQGAAGSFTEQLPAMPAAAAAAASNPIPVAADQWQQAAWMQQQHHQGATAVPPRPPIVGRRSHSWHSADSDVAAAAAHQAPGQRHYGSTHRQHSWHSDDLAGGTAGGRSGCHTGADELVWLPWLPTPPQLTWQDHMKNLEASLMRKDADTDPQDRDSTARADRDTNVITASDRSAGTGPGMGPTGGYYRAGTGKTPSKGCLAGIGGYGGSGRWHHVKGDDTPGHHRRKAQWQQQQQPADTDGLSALLAVAAAAEAGDTDNPDAGADALAGLLSIAAAAGASNVAAAAATGHDEAAVVLTKEQEQEWLALTGALAAVLTGAADPPTPGFREGPKVTAELLAAIRFLAHKGAAKQQGAAAAEAGDVGLPFEILSTVEQWMLERSDHPAAAAANKKQQQQVQGSGYSLDREVGIAEALACASEAGITLEARQIYLLVLYHVLCMKEQQLKQKLQELGIAAVKPQQQQQVEEEEAKNLAAADQAAAPMEVDDAAAATAAPTAAAAPAAAAPGSEVSQQQQQEIVYAATGDHVDMQDPSAAAAAPHAAAQTDPATAAAAAVDTPAAAQEDKPPTRHMPLASSQLANKQLAAPAAATGLCKSVRPPPAAAAPVLAALADQGKDAAGAAAAAVVVGSHHQQPHTPAPTVSSVAVPVGMDATAGVQGQVAVDPAAAAAAAGAEVNVGLPSPAPAGYMSRWGSGVV